MSDKKQILYANDNATLEEINETWQRLKKANREFYFKLSAEQMDSPKGRSVLRQ